VQYVASLSPLGLTFYILVITAAFAVRSAAGFGAVLIAMPMLAFVLPVSTAVSITTALTAITSLHHLSRDWHRVAWRHFMIIAFYSAIGIGVGFFVINLLDEDALRRSLGVFLIFYALYAWATAGASPVLPARWRRALAAFAGLRAAHVVLDPQRAVGRNVRMAPGGRVVTMAADRHSDTHLALVHGGLVCGSI
jgi:uncharacterized membrane protein YfcA